MRISYKNNPAIEYLNRNKLGVIPIIEGDVSSFNIIKEDAKNSFSESIDCFRSEVNIISQYFANACEKNDKKLIGLYEDFCINDIADLNVCGTYIFNGLTFMIDHKMKKGSEDMFINFFIFGKRGEILAFLHHGEVGGMEIFWASNHVGINNLHELKKAVMSWFIRVVVFYLFKNYAEVETKHVKPNQVLRGIGCNYSNGTNNNVTFLDCKWFTNIVRSDGFKVRGHFRLQKYGYGLSKIKIIWINDFEKEGYTSKAKTLIN